MRILTEASGSLVSAYLIRASQGEVFSEDNLKTKRTAHGRSPMLWNTLVGTSAELDYALDELILS